MLKPTRHAKGMRWMSPAGKLIIAAARLRRVICLMAITLRTKPRAGSDPEAVEEAGGCSNSQADDPKPSTTIRNMLSSWNACKIQHAYQPFARYKNAGHRLLRINSYFCFVDAVTGLLWRGARDHARVGRGGDLARGEAEMGSQPVGSKHNAPAHLFVNDYLRA